MSSARRWLAAAGAAARRRCSAGAAGPARGRRRGRRTTPPTACCVVGVPGLVWSDVDPDGARPSCGRWPRESSIGAMSVRAARSTTCLLDGWATLGAGNRARVPGPGRGPAAGAAADRAAAGGRARPPPTATPDRPGRRGGRAEPRGGHLAVLLRPAGADRRGRRWTTRRRPSQRTADDEGTARFGAEPGALGDGASAAPRCRAGPPRWPSPRPAWSSTRPSAAGRPGGARRRARRAAR